MTLSKAACLTPPVPGLRDVRRAFVSVILLLITTAGTVWAEGVPDALIGASRMPDGRPAHAIVVEKRTQTISLYRYADGYRKIADWPCSTGKAHGDKQVSGDMRTPEGIYFFTDNHSDEELSPVYGTRAYPLNYPNILDRRAGKGGFAIWMHGTDRPLAPYDSNGCVALNNTDIDRLAGLIDWVRTPIIITESLSYAPDDDRDALRSRLTAAIEQWRRHLAEGSYHQYLAMYPADYLPPIGWWPDWQHFRNKMRDAGKGVDVALDDMAFFRYRDILAVTFRQILVAGEETVPAGRRMLYFRTGDGRLEIVGDEYQRLDDDSRGETVPLVAALRKVIPADDAAGKIADFVARWVAAWSSKDIDAYGDCYAEAFTARRMNKRQWLAYKQTLNAAYDHIQVTAGDLSISVQGDTAVVHLTQRYTSDRYQSQGRKTLHLIRQDDQWKIRREIYSGQ